MPYRRKETLGLWLWVNKSTIRVEENLIFVCVIVLGEPDGDEDLAEVVDVAVGDGAVEVEVESTGVEVLVGDGC